MDCNRAPKTTCPRCGGPWWHCLDRGFVYHSCLCCGYVPEDALSPERDAILRLERAADHKPRGLAAMPYGRENELRYRLTGVDNAALATLRAMA